MQICKDLNDKLSKYSEASGATLDDLLGLLLYEIPDEVLGEFAAMANPVEIEVSPELELVASGMAEAFGMTVLGMSVLMNKIIDRTLATNKRKEEVPSGV